MQHMAWVDFWVLGIYFVAVIAVGFFSSRGQSTSTDYFLGGRNIGWFAVGTSLFATNISSEHFIGLSGSGATSGLAIGHFEWLACIIVLILAWVFVPFYHRSGVFTMPEFLERRYDQRCRMYLTSVSIVAYVLTKIAVALYGGALVLKATVGWDFLFSAVVIVLFTGVYTIFGGLTAVIYTDVLQAFILVGGAALLTILGLDKVGGFAGLRAALPADYFSMMRPATDPDFPWTGIFLGAPILGVWYWCTDQVIVQKTLSARTIEEGRRGAIFSGYLKILPVFILVLPGLIAKALYPDVTGDTAYPTLVLRLLPQGLVGLMVAALLAALMSSLSSTFNSASTLITFDFYKRLHPDAKEETLIRIGRLSTVVLVVLGIAWIPFMKFISAQLFVYLQSVQAYISPPIAAVFLLGVLWPRANANGAFASLMSGLLMGGFRFVVEVWHGMNPFGDGFFKTVVGINFLHYALLMFVVCTFVLVIVSWMSDPPTAEKLRDLTFAGTPKTVRDEGVGRSVSVVASVLLVFVLCGLWFYFR